MTFVTHPGRYRVFSEALLLPGLNRVRVRAEQQCRLFVEFDGEEVLAGLGVGHIDLEVVDGVLRVESKGRVWVSVEARSQKTLRPTTEVYTTLDRPEPLSPEMAAIYRLSRQNELARERDRAEMERKYQDVIAKRTATVPDRGDSQSPKSGVSKGAEKADDRSAGSNKGEAKPIESEGGSRSSESGEMGKSKASEASAG